MKNPYTLALFRQVGEVPFQLAHHLRASRPLSRPEKHRFGGAWRQYLLFWMPPAGIPLRDSVVMLWHGGGWEVGWPGLHPTFAEFFLRAGFPVAMPAYRLSPWASYRHMREDLSLALAYTLEMMQKRDLENKKILAGGMSAGGTLAAHLVFDRTELQKLGVGQDLFSGFISFAGPLDLDRMPPFGAVRRYAGGRPGTDAFRAANPILYLQGDETVPAFFIHGTGDAVVPYACSEAFFQQYAGPKVLHTLPGKSHLGSMRFATDDAVTARALGEWLMRR